MHGPPRDPRDHSVRGEPTWTDLLVSYGLIAGAFLLFWAVSQPLAALVAVAAVLALVLGVRRAAKLVRCLRECGGFVVDLGGAVQVCVTRASADGTTPCAENV